MKNAAKMIATAALLLVAGCEVNVDNNLEAAVETQTDALGSDLENAANDAGNTLESAGEAVGNQVDKLDNVDIDVNLNRRHDEAATTNKQ